MNPAIKEGPTPKLSPGPAPTEEVTIPMPLRSDEHTYNPNGTPDESKSPNPAGVPSPSNPDGAS